MGVSGLMAAGLQSEALVVVVFSVALSLGGALVLLFAQGELAEARRSQSWPATMGWVVRSQGRQCATDTGYVYFADIAYEYTVGAQRFVGQRVRFSEPGYGPGAQRDRAMLTIQRYPVGHPMAVYYDPRRPEAAVLERRVSPGLRLPFVMGTGMLLAGVISGLSWATALAAPLVP